eukprot:scpid92355/ scgid18049/ 
MLSAVDGKEIDKVNAKAVGTKVKRVRYRRKKLLKDKAEDAISELLCQPFVLPELDVIPAHNVGTESCDIQKENASKFEKNSVESLSKKIIDLEEELARKRETAEICCVFHAPNLTHRPLALTLLLSSGCFKRSRLKRDVNRHVARQHGLSYPDSGSLSQGSDVALWGSHAMVVVCVCV